MAMIRAMVGRRLMLAGAAGLAAGTVAAALALRKPGGPVVHGAVAAPAEGAETVPFLDMSALMATEPARPVGEIAIRDTQGQPHRLAEFAGRPLLLNLWATWCVPCVAELPELAALARQLAAAPADRTGLRVLAVSTDRGGAPVVDGFLRAHGIAGLPVWLDPQGEAADALQTRGVPTTLLIDRAGRERARMEGPADWASPAAHAAIAKLTA